MIDKPPFFEEFENLCNERGIVLPRFEIANDTSATMKIWETIGKDPKFHEAIDDFQRLLGEKGDLVLDGKRAINVIKKADLKIWLMASSEERARRFCERDGIGFEESLRIVKERISSPDAI